MKMNIEEIFNKILKKLNEEERKQDCIDILKELNINYKITTIC